MTRADQTLLDKQFRWLSRSRADELFVLSAVSSILLIIIVLGSTTIA